MNQIYTRSRSTLFIILSFIILFFSSTELFAKAIDSRKIDEILNLINQQGYSANDLREKLVTDLKTTDDNKQKVELLIQLSVYSMFLDRYDEVKIYSNRLHALANQINNQSAIDVAKVYLIVGEVKMQDPAKIAHENLKRLLPELIDKRAKIHYHIALAMTAIREDFPILENQLLRNTLQKISGQSSFAFEEFSIHWALSAISKDANEYIELTLQLFRSSNKNLYPIDSSIFLNNLNWHLSIVNEQHLSNKVADELFKVAGITLDEQRKVSILLAFLDTKARNKISLPPETLAYIISVKTENEFWQAWLNTILSFYYATNKNEKESHYYLNLAKRYFDSQPDLPIPDEFIEIESILAFDNKNYLEARATLEKYWWKKYLTIKKSQQSNILNVRNALNNVINEEQKSKVVVEQLLLESKQTSFILATGFFAIFILIIFQYRMYLKLKRSKEKLKKVSITDGLTNMNNRRYWSDCIVNELNRLKRNTNHRSSLLMLDIDFFKKINDSFGHIAGDVVIKRIASIILEGKRTFDVEGRYGGEEFALLLIDCTAKGAIKVAERIRVAAEQTVITYKESPIEFTVSIGIAEFNESVLTMDDWVNLADTALYESKNSGRNRTSVYQ
ncbi:MAG: diguanylate cyclase [Thalassotalea sp.]|nr:diguanylate cyclase [Thalassotalea sp.]